MKAAIVVGLLLAFALPSSAQTLAQYREMGYVLSKCGTLASITTVATVTSPSTVLTQIGSPVDSVIAPEGYRIGRLDIKTDWNTASANGDQLWVAIKQVYTGTHLDSFPHDPSAGRVVSRTSSTTIDITVIASKASKEASYPCDTDRIYLIASSGSVAYSWWSYCAYLYLRGGAGSPTMTKTAFLEL